MLDFDDWQNYIYFHLALICESCGRYDEEILGCWDGLDPDDLEEFVKRAAAKAKQDGWSVEPGVGLDSRACCPQCQAERQNTP